jgi:hypothetical protein
MHEVSEVRGFPDDTPCPVRHERLDVPSSCSCPIVRASTCVPVGRALREGQ